MAAPTTPLYAARLDIEYTERRNRLTVAFRGILAIPVFLLLLLVDVSLFFATVAAIVVRRRYPRWWFDFIYEYSKFSQRVAAYVSLLVDEYPAIEDEQRVHLALDYPDARTDLNRWLPLIKWALAIPHYVVLVVLGILWLVVTIIAWFAIVITGRFPRGLFDFSVGLQRWGWRVSAYAFLLVTDRYPPFRLAA